MTHAKEYQFSLEFTVADEEALFEAAVTRAIDDGYTEQDAREHLRDEEYGIDVRRCAQMLLDPGSIPGCIEIIDSSCE